MEIKKKDSFGDVLKGIGIVMVVMGHSWLPTVPFVYTCHLAIFFLVMGMHFSEKKYSKAPLLMFSNRMTSLWPQFVFFTSLFVIFRNLFIDTGFYSITIPRYNLGIAFQHILYSFVFYSSEQMGGAMWFVAMFLIGSAFMGAVFYLGNKYFHDDPKKRYVFVGTEFTLIGIIGLIAINKGMNLPFNYQTGLLLLPLAFVGFIFSLFKEKVIKYITWQFAILMTIFIWYVVGVKGIRIDGPADKLITLVLYYPITLAGIYISLWIGKILKLNKYTNFIFSIAGKYSFEIMALHFLCFKFVDLIYVKINGRSFNELSGFPTSFNQLGPIYVIIGVGLPVIVVTTWKYIKEKLENLIAQSQHLSEKTDTQ